MLWFGYDSSMSPKVSCAGTKTIPNVHDKHGQPLGLGGLALRRDKASFMEWSHCHKNWNSKGAWPLPWTYLLPILLGTPSSSAMPSVMRLHQSQTDALTMPSHLQNCLLTINLLSLEILHIGYFVTAKETHLWPWKYEVCMASWSYFTL